MAKTTTIMEEGHQTWTATYILTVNALVSGSVTGQKITTVPAGFIFDTISVSAPAMGASTGLTVGDDDDKNRLFAVADTSGATDNQNGMIKATATAGAITAGEGYQYDTETAVLLYNSGGSNTTGSDLTVIVKISGRVDISGSNYIDQ